MARLFVGVPVPKLDGFAEVQERIEGPDRLVKPVDLDQTHVTLKFLGDTDEDRIPAIVDAIGNALDGIEAHQGRAEGVGAFPSPRKARVVWAGVKDTELPAMADAVEAAVEPLGFEPKDRSFTPHVTLARLKRHATLTVELDMYRERVFGDVPIATVVLFESKLSSEGPTYLHRHEWSLGGGADGD